MNRILTIGLFLLALSMAACDSCDHLKEMPCTANPELSAIDSLMWQRPDSALTCLLAYFDSCRDVSGNVSENTNDTVLGDVSGNVSTVYNHHYANLLLAELLYKNDYTQTNREELLQAVDYFDSLCLCTDGACTVSTITTFMDARAHYINGVGYYEHDSVVEACKEYLKALEIMEGRFDEKELSGNKAKFMALTFTHLTGLYSDYYLHDQAICFGIMASNYHKKYNAESWHTAWILNEIGSQHEMLEELDSASCYYRKAETVLNDTNSLMFRDIASHQACLEYKKDPFQLNRVIKQLQHLLLKSENFEERLARCAAIGEIYYNEKQFDSAWNYLNMVFNYSSNIGAKKQVAEWLVDIKKENNEPDFLEYAEFLVPFANLEENKSALKTQLIDLYNVYCQKKSEKFHQNERRKQLQFALAFTCSLIIVISIVLFLYKRNHRQKQNLEIQIETERQTHKVQQAALAGRLKRSNAALKELYNATRMFSSENTNQNRADSFTEEPICKQILAKCNDKNNPIKSTVPVSAYAGLALTDIEKAQLKKAVMSHYSALFENLKHRFPKLKEKDYFYCYLCLVGLDNTQMAVLLQNSTSTIWDRENRLKQVFHSEDKISVFLQSMIISGYQDINQKSEKTESCFS